MVYASAATERVINLYESAAKQIFGLQKERGWVHVKVGVRNAGCSGMSYVFEPCKIEDINAEDVSIRVYSRNALTTKNNTKSDFFFFLKTDYLRRLYR